MNGIGNKLFNLYVKVIDKIDDLSYIDEKTYRCEFKDGTDTHYISLSKSMESFESGKKIFNIKFQDLLGDITETQYDIIVEKVKDRIKHLTEIEQEKERKRQEKIVDRLLDNLD